MRPPLRCRRRSPVAQIGFLSRLTSMGYVILPRAPSLPLLRPSRPLRVPSGTSLRREAGDQAFANLGVHAFLDNPTISFTPHSKTILLQTRIEYARGRFPERRRLALSAHVRQDMFRNSPDRASPWRHRDAYRRATYAHHRELFKCGRRGGCSRADAYDAVAGSDAHPQWTQQSSMRPCASRPRAS